MSPISNTCFKDKIDPKWDVLKRLLLELDITIQEKNLVLARFYQIYNHIETHFKHVQFFYNYSKVFLSIASVMNPAFLSITANTEKTAYVSLFWFVWTSQIIVSLITTFITFFKWDKKYFMYMVYNQRVEQEIWMYLELTGKYSIVHPLNETEISLMHTTHQSKIKFLLLQLESLFKKIKESDYTIESMEGSESSEHQSGVKAKAHPSDGKMLRREVMNRKIDALVNAYEHTADYAMKDDIQKNIGRLRKLQVHNQMTDTHLNSYSPAMKYSPVPLSMLEQEVDEDKYERYPR